MTTQFAKRTYHPARPIGAGARVHAGNDAAGQLLHAGAVMAILLVPIGLSPITGFLSLVLCAAAAFVAAMLLGVASVRLGNLRDMSGFLFVPLIVSASQNIYLGVIAPYTDSFHVQLALMTHITYATLLLLSYFFVRERGPIHPLLSQLIIVAIGICLFAAVSVVAFHASILGMITSARNMLSPFLFLMLGLLLAERVRLATFLTLVAMLAWATIAFGFVEYLSVKSVWSALNIDQLWIKKGIPNLAEWGMPANFVSSEKFFGEQVRRMVSSYADPVNFGTVLFLFFMVAWYTRRWALVVACLIATALAISKGAVLGLLIFVMVRMWHSGNRALFAFGVAVSCVAGAGVVGYTLTHSTQSLATHVQGLWAAIMSLPEHPFGRGLGGVGVLAKDRTDLRESGLGLIIGQLGVLAFVLFGTFFYGIWRWISRLADQRTAVFARSMFLGLFANIAFNEVALSPNSSAGYFVLLGLLITGDWLRRRAAEAGAQRPAESR